MRFMWWESPVVDAVSHKTKPGVRDGCLTVASGASPQRSQARLRDEVGLCDHSYCGKIRVSGPGALEAVERLLAADLTALGAGRMGTYEARPDSGVLPPEVTVVSDGQGYLLLTEGVPSAEAAQQVASQAGPATVEDVTDGLVLLGVEGPLAARLMRDLAPGAMGARHRDVVLGERVAGIRVTVCRHTKTGGFGYLLLADAGDGAELWRRLLAAGARYGLTECGFEDVDACRLDNEAFRAAWALSSLRVRGAEMTSAANGASNDGAFPQRAAGT